MNKRIQIHKLIHTCVHIHIYL